MSSKRRIRRRSCRGKRRHPNFPLAKRAIALLAGSGRQDGYVQPYPCKFCGGVHVGHPRRRRAKGA